MSFCTISKIIKSTHLISKLASVLAGASSTTLVSIVAVIDSCSEGSKRSGVAGHLHRRDIFQGWDIHLYNNHRVAIFSEEKIASFARVHGLNWADIFLRFFTTFMVVLHQNSVHVCKRVLWCLLESRSGCSPLYATQIVVQSSEVMSNMK